MCIVYMYVFSCRQKTAYEMRISDWSSDVCSSDLVGSAVLQGPRATGEAIKPRVRARQQRNAAVNADERHAALPRRSKRRCDGRIVLHRLIAQRGGKDRKSTRLNSSH